MSVHRHRLLIVDDEVHVVDGLRRTLRHENYDIITTTSPLEALEHLRSGTVDILISDIDMPEMTGLELIATARAQHPEVVRILLTGDASIDSALEAINQGAVRKYLTKPWTAQGLRETLRETVVSLDALRAEAASTVAADRDAANRQDLEERYPGISACGRVEGAYLLNDMRIVELLSHLDGNNILQATSWLPVSADATLDMRRK